MVDAALQTLAELGAQVEEVTIPTLHYAGAAQPAIMLSEAFAYHQRLCAASQKSSAIWSAPGSVLVAC